MVFGVQRLGDDPKIDPKVPQFTELGGGWKPMGFWIKKWPGRFFFFGSWSLVMVGVVFGSRNGMGINPWVAGILPWILASVVGYGEKITGKSWDMNTISTCVLWLWFCATIVWELQTKSIRNTLGVCTVFKNQDIFILSFERSHDSNSSIPVLHVHSFCYLILHFFRQSGSFFLVIHHEVSKKSPCLQ